jgi:mannose-1-phosphate guanylyltransferase
MSDFHAILFAGGAGQRLWPLSRRNSPKQFTPLLGSKSSIQLAVDRLLRVTSPERIYVGTNQAYAGILHEQLPDIPERNFILEPARKDVAAAVALAFFTLKKDGIRGPVIFQWSDHYVSEADRLVQLFETAGKLIRKDGRRIILVAEQPRYANDNLGWIELGQQQGEIDGLPYHQFGAWRYRPPLPECQQMLATGGWVWNTGHFITSVEFMTESFEQLSPSSKALASGVKEIVAHRGTPQEQAKLAELFPQLPALSFDQAFLQEVPRDQALLFTAELGWVDPGNLFSLKEALQTSPEATVTRGNVVEMRTKNCFVYNGTDRPVVTMGLSDVMVVEMADVTLVIHKDSVRDLGQLLKELEARGLTPLL